MTLGAIMFLLGIIFCLAVLKLMDRDGDPLVTIVLFLVAVMLASAATLGNP